MTIYLYEQNYRERKRKHEKESEISSSFYPLKITSYIRYLARDQLGKKIVKSFYRSPKVDNLSSLSSSSSKKRGRFANINYIDETSIIPWTINYARCVSVFLGNSASRRDSRSFSLRRERTIHRTSPEFSRLSAITLSIDSFKRTFPEYNITSSRHGGRPNEAPPPRQIFVLVIFWDTSMSQIDDLTIGTVITY